MKKKEVSPLTRSDESAKPVAKMVEILMIEARLGWPDSENERSQYTLLGTLDPEVSARLLSQPLYGRFNTRTAAVPILFQRQFLSSLILSLFYLKS